MTWKVSSYKILFESSITDLKKGQSESHSVVSDSLRPHALYSPWNSPHQNTGVGSLSLLQRIFPIQGSNPGLLHCRRILYQLNHKGSPRILEWVAYPFSSESSHPRNWTGDLPNPGIKPRSPLLHVDSLPAKPRGKPKNMGLGSLSLLLQISPIQELNRGLHHCRWILSQLS